jgi:hypothetical protein
MKCNHSWLGIYAPLNEKGHQPIMRRCLACGLTQYSIIKKWKTMESEVVTTWGGDIPAIPKGMEK